MFRHYERGQLVVWLVGLSCLLAGPDLRAQPNSGSALRFDGTNTLAQGPTSSVFDRYPLTVTAWIRTTAQDAQVRGIASKYADASFNGWSVFLYNGHVHAWFFRDSSDFVWDGALGLDGGAVADGQWHHIAFVVDASGGRLLVDGVQQASLAWTGVAGSNTSSDFLRFGQYSTYAAKFQGDLDEISIWDQALSTDTVNYIKHRRLNGNEDGLAGLWHLDEGAGTTATDSTVNAWVVNLVGGPLWVPSSAPVALSPVAATAIKLNGVSDQVVVSNTPASLNSLPITLMAWVKTTQTGSSYAPVIAKYLGASGQGYALALYGGHVTSWYYANGANYVFSGIPSGSDRFVADGNWHHVAFVVDGTSGRTYIDGVLTNTTLWVGTAGPTTTTSDLRLGFYSGLGGGYLNGQMDHVSIWNAALTASQISQYAHLPLIGSEPGLLSAYEFNEASGNTATDLTGLANGTASGTLTRVGSLARIGDGSVHLLGALDVENYGRRWRIQNSAAFNRFPVPAVATLRRFYDFGNPPPVVPVSATISSTLSDAASQNIPLTPASSYSNSVVLDAYNASAPPTAVAQATFAVTLPIAPTAQLKSVTDTYAVSATFSHQPSGGGSVTDEVRTLPLAQLLDFDGKLFFGSLETRFTSVTNNPAPGAADGGGIDTQLAVDGNSGYLPSKPDHTYGDGTAINAILFDSGDALAAAGTSITLNGPTQDSDCVQNICFDRSSLRLTSTGAVGFVSMVLPAGFSVGIDTGIHVTLGRLEYANVPLDATLFPNTNSLTTAGPLYGIEETLPFWIAAPSLTWDISNGQIVLNPTGGVFVRQEEDDILTASQALLKEPNAANRISNDGYFRNASITPGNPFTVVADANGVARITAGLNLNPPELRPHFPYSGPATGDEIPTAPGGKFVLVDGVIDRTNSVLPVSGPVPVSYARDCEDTNCSAALAGPASLKFTPNSNQLGFTPDGGLLAYGSVPPTNLMWGYVSGNNFAQRTSDVQAGAYDMAGTFLGGDQTAFDDMNRPAVLLFSGFGDATDATYFERPGMANYADGFANYAGLNFRAPTSGRSFIANQDTGIYPLTARSKYYVRYGGVSGIHESATFPSSLTLYGYSFTFLTYRLSFLDSENYESRTDGAISFPQQPAGFEQEFERMKFTCRGGLDSAQVPASSPSKHLNYWNVTFTPQSIEFHPQNDDVCGTGTRFLVLGVETTLPFIPQALDATLGFKPNGNLVTVADNVAGADSRFPVPAQLTLQGPGTTVFPLSTASEGYFNNWETANRPDAGFYNLAGKLRVPFFSDIKVHLQITPTGTNTATINMMGGWPAADSSAADLGWSVNSSNYFNQAKFDPHADGWPEAQGVSLADYQNSPTTKYRPRAQRDWIEVATFDYPLQWNPVLREFEGFQDAKVILPVIDVNSRLKELAPGKVDFDFAQDINLQLPRIKVLDLVNDALNGQIGPLLSVSNAVRQELGAVLDTTGLNELSHALREDAHGFFDPMLGTVLNPAVADMYPQLTALDQSDKAAFLNQVYGIINAPGGALQTHLGDLNGAVGQANSVVGTLDQTLTDAQNSVGLLIRILGKDGSGNRHVVRAIVQKLVQDQGPALGFAVDLADQPVNQLLADLEPTLAQIQSQLTDVSNQLAQVHAQLLTASGGFNQALGSVLNDSTGVSQYLQAAAQDVTNYLASVVTPSGDYFTADPAAVKNALRQRLEDAFLASSMSGNYQQTIKQFLYDKNFLIDQLMNTLFDQINRAIREGLTSLIANAQDGVFQNMKGPGLMSQSLLSAKIRGSPTFNGDSLRSIHLDAAIKMNLPDEMNFNAYMDIKELDSQSSPVGCIPDGAPAAEVTLGADDVPLDWGGVSPTPGSKLTLSVQARWTLQTGNVLGIGGLFDIKGEAGFKGCSVKEIGATLAIGQLENYFAAKAAGTVVILGIPVDVQAGLFAGHACSLDPLKFIDPEADQVLNNPDSFSGIYIEFGGGVSLSEILFDTSSCFLDVEAHETTALYYEGGPKLGTLGGRQKMSVDVSLICIISAHVDWSTFMALSYGKLTLGASANVCGSVGACPFCVSACKGITVTGTLTDGGIDYSFDF